MPRKDEAEKTYKVVGTSSIVIGATQHYPGDEFDANPADVTFFEQVGAVEVVRGKKDD